MSGLKIKIFTRDYLRKLGWVALALGCFHAVTASGADAADKARAWPAEVREIRYASAADDSQQPAKYYDSGSKKKRPLLVALHTWSGDYRQLTSVPYAQWCIENDWIMIHPNFRGSNTTPEAMGSELAVADILSAVDHAKASSAVNESRIYLAGASGGGYASLLMAGRAPEIWAGVSAWVPINDLQAWYFETRERKLGYADHIVKAAGGIPEKGSNAAEECRKRSAATYLPRARGVSLDINAGIHDGYTGSVPVSHTLNAFNLVARESDRLSAEQIEHFTKKQEVPTELKAEAETDGAYGAKKVLFRRQSGTVRVTIFEGGHEIIPDAALAWLARQEKDGGKN